MYTLVYDRYYKGKFVGQGKSAPSTYADLLNNICQWNWNPDEWFYIPRSIVLDT